MVTNTYWYANYKQYSVKYYAQTEHFELLCGHQGGFLEGDVTLYDRENALLCLSSYEQKHILENKMDDALLTIHFSQNGQSPSFSLQFQLNRNGIHAYLISKEKLSTTILGKMHLGQGSQQDVFAMCFDRIGTDFRSALGPASSSVDHALFDRENDVAIVFSKEIPVRIQYNWEEQLYHYTIHSNAGTSQCLYHVCVETRVYTNRYQVHYKPMNPNNIFSKPPAGWMTWYAVKFEASEEEVLKNARWQSQHLKDFGADTIWVDWEWFHDNLKGIGEPDVDTFHPSLKRYPHGLKYLAEEIERLGLVPALWVGFTNDPNENSYMKKYPGMLLAHQPEWCGQHFLDVSHPDYLEKYLPDAFGQVLDWGYKALKWDCIPITLKYLDQYHDVLYRSKLSSEEILHHAMSTVRKIIGQDFYMLQCSGIVVRDITMATDVFDAARIGNDIFEWEEFISQCVERVMKFYLFHSVLFYNDPDNVILRPEYNTFDQAISRLSFVSLLGLPITFGDVLPDLPADRVELLKRGLPTISAHPMDVRDTILHEKALCVNLAVATPFESWNVIDILNLSNDRVTKDVQLANELHIDEGAYLIYDYWQDQFLGVFTDTVSISLEPNASKVLGIRLKKATPQIMSTSRHVTQGAIDLVAVTWQQGDQTLSGISSVVVGDRYTITFYIPDGFYPLSAKVATENHSFESVGESICKLTIVPSATKEISWAIRFART